MNDKLINLVADLKEKEALAFVKEKINQGVDPLSILDDTRKAMEMVGKRFESGDYFLPDLIMAGAIIGEISKIMKPHIQKERTEAKKGKVIIGTVAGDIHDIGKDIVVFMLDVNGYEVFDLGIDVPVDTFVSKIREVNPPVVGLSGLLTLAFDSMKKTVEAIEKAGLRQGVKIMIGGGQIDEEVRKYVKADAYGKDAVAAVTLCREWIG
ncbi:MAG: cobalamin-dependent protein [Methanothrix sp.]|nr:cobalamin-dependent protein [Methanothrix sp.]